MNTDVLRSPNTGARPHIESRIEDWSTALARGSVFAVLSNTARTRLAARGSLMTLALGARLCAEGDVADAAYLVIAGELEISLTKPDGAVVWLARAAPGEVVGDMALLDGGARSADIAAARNTRLLRLGRDAVLQALTEEPAAALALLAHLAGRLRKTNGHLEDIATLDLGARLARLLLESPSGLTSRSQSGMAGHLGVARESVNRKLAGWRKAGLIAVGVSGVRVLAADRLRAEALDGAR